MYIPHKPKQAEGSRKLARQPGAKDLRSAIDTSYFLLEKTNAEFEKTGFLADGVSLSSALRGMRI